MEAVSHHSGQIEEVQPVSTKENMKIESARGKKSKDEQKTVSFVCQYCDKAFNVKIMLISEPEIVI